MPSREGPFFRGVDWAAGSTGDAVRGSVVEANGSSWLRDSSKLFSGWSGDSVAGSDAPSLPVRAEKAADASAA